MSIDTRQVIIRVSLWGIVVVGAVMSVHLARGMMDLWKGQERLGMAQQQLLEVEQQKEGIERELQWRSSETFAEQQIRETLHLAREGEVVVRLDEGLYVDLSEEEESRSDEVVPVWKQWWELLFRKQQQ